MINYFCKGDDEACSFFQPVINKIAETEERILEALKNCTNPGGMAQCEDAQCEDNWTQFQGSCYLVSDTSTDFSKAVISCTELGAKLVHVENEMENSFLRNLIRGSNELKPYSYWIGLTDKGTEGVWVWRNNGTSTPAIFTDWNDGEPNDTRDNEDCVHLYFRFGHTWNDIPCDSLNRFVCEKEVN